MPHLSNLAAHIQANILAALEEDIGSGDLTAQLIPPQQTGHATVITRQDAVLCGTQWFDGCFKTIDPSCTIHWFAQDGAAIKAGQTICEINGNARALLTADASFKNALRKAGLLTRDPREKERKKPGLKKARKAPTYTKR